MAEIENPYLENFKNLNSAQADMFYRHLYFTALEKAPNDSFLSDNEFMSFYNAVFSWLALGKVIDDTKSVNGFLTLFRLTDRDIKNAFDEATKPAQV